MKRLLYKGEPVVTFKMVDELHEKGDDSARKAFHRHKKHFIEGEHYYTINADYNLLYNTHLTALPNNSLLPQGEHVEKPFFFDESIEIHEDETKKTTITVLTASGYLFVVKPFTDDLSWTIQAKLIDAYFEVNKRRQIAYDKEIETMKITYEAENKRLRHELFLQYRAMQDRVGPCIDGLKERLSKYEPVDRKFMPLDEAWQTFGQGMKRKHFMRIITKYKIPTRIREDIDGNKVKDLFIHGLETAISNFIAQCKPHCKEPGIYVHPLMREPFVLR